MCWAYFKKPYIMCKRCPNIKELYSSCKNTKPKQSWERHRNRLWSFTIKFKLKSSIRWHITLMTYKRRELVICNLNMTVARARLLRLAVFTSPHLSLADVPTKSSPFTLLGFHVSVTQGVASIMGDTDRCSVRSGSYPITNLFVNRNSHGESIWWF